jgi:hypothetical protein
MPRGEISIVDNCLVQFAATAGRAGVFEIRVRMLADSVKLSGALKENLKPLLENRVLPWLRAETPITPDEIALLEASVIIRNKLFHFEFSSVAGRLEGLGVELAKQTVLRFNVPDPISVESFTAGMKAAIPVSETVSEEGGMIGWLFNAVGSGAFGEASDVFDRATALVIRLHHEWTAKLVAATMKTT